MNHDPFSTAAPVATPSICGFLERVCARLALYGQATYSVRCAGHDGIECRIHPASAGSEKEPYRWVEVDPRESLLRMEIPKWRFGITGMPAALAPADQERSKAGAVSTIVPAAEACKILAAQWRAIHPELCEIWNTYKENTMQEKLIPFDLEEAKKNPERVRLVCAAFSDWTVHFVGDTVVVDYGRGHADAFGSAEHCQLRLVALPKTKQYRVYSVRYSRELQLVAQKRWYAADNDRHIFRVRDRVRDVSFDKATGVITVTYDE